MNKVLLSSRNILFLLIGLVFLVYWGSWNAFFQQDEWAGLGNFYSLQGLAPAQILKELYAPMFKQELGHFLFFTPLVNYLRYSLFELNYPPYILLSLVLHVTASFLVYLLAFKLSKDKCVAITSSLFFAIASSASQAVTWVGTSLPTQLAAIFSLLSIFFFLSWLEKQARKNLWLSVASLVFAISFKETAVFLFVFLPAVGFIKRPEVRKRLIFLFLSFAMAYAALRLAVGGLSQTILLVNSAAQNFLIISLRGITQALFPAELILQGIDKAVQLINPEGIPLKGEHLYDVFLEEEVVKPFMALFGLVFILVYASWAKLDKQRQPATFISLLLLLAAFVPLAFISTGELSATFLSPRGLYIPGIGISLLLGLTFATLVKTRYKYKKVVIFFLSVLFLGTHVFFLREQIKGLVMVGMERKTILEKIEREYPNLPDRAVFYTRSNRAYYGLPPEENIMPFQSGFGQTLLVWYYPKEGWSREFLQNRFLWGIKEQGYNEVGGQGFGYFRDFDLLKEALTKYNIPRSSVIAFDWDSEALALTDISELVSRKLEITEEIRDELD